MPQSATDAPTLTVAVTGAAGFVAAAVLERLGNDRSVTRILGIDCDEPQMPVAKLDFRTADIRDPVLTNALEGADVIIHLALTPGPQMAEDTMFAVNVHGTRNVLDAAAKAGVKRFIHLSSATVYGAHPGNHVPLDEDAPLRANPDFSWAYQHLLAEELVTTWAREHPDTTVTVFRPTTTLGPGADTFVARHLEQPVLPIVRANEPPVQLLHVDDLAAAIHLAVTKPMPGVFNVGAEGWLTARELAKLMGRPAVTIPEAIAFAAARQLWVHGVLGAPAGALHYMMYPWVLSCDALHDQGWSATRSNREIIREFCVEHRPFVSFGRFRAQRRHLAMAGAAASATFTVLLFRTIRRWRRGVRDSP